MPRSSGSSSSSEWASRGEWDSLAAALIAQEERELAAMGLGDGSGGGGSRAGSSSSAAGASSSRSASALVQRLQQEVSEVEAETGRLTKALQEGQGLEELDSRQHSSVTSALAASKRRRDALAASTGDLGRRMAEAGRRLQFREKGVDVCILMDCTGSMGNHIEAAKAKALDIMGLAPTVHPDAITRLAFVGYRDFGKEAGDWGGNFVVVDFVDKHSFSELHDAVSAVCAGGGSDAENVTGALKQALGLSWSSSTRLIVHFGDAPCHGNRYHSGRPVNGPDTYPDGNPDGLVPEELLEQLIANRVDYHFARIGTHTDIMTGIFQEVYDASDAASFKIHEYGTNTEAFLPVVLKSITSSMRRSFRHPSSGSSSSSSSRDSGAALVAPCRCQSATIA